MIPIRDTIPSRHLPVMNYVLIGITSAVFLLQVRAGEQGTALVERYGVVPARFFNPDEPVVIRQQIERRTPIGIQRAVIQREVQPAAVPNILTLLTCIFLHGGWMHFLGNMWFLYIFGDNVEDRFGHWGFLLLYLVCGVLASVAHLVTNSASPLPTIGASGAIAGVMGSYLFLYPRGQVVTVIPIFFFLEVIVLPAPIFLGIWFAIQFFQGLFSITAAPTGGVAWWAHIGGFAVGLVVTLLLTVTRRLQPPPPEASVHHPALSHYRVYPRH